jgi:Transport and Golgi organisation 2
VCTVITLQRPGHAWPLLIAANRDERIDRAWDPPAAYWPDRPGVVGGRDRLGGGTWMALNQHGVVCAVLNRTGSLGPAPGKRSRGELPLMAVEHHSAACATAALLRLDGTAYRSFNLIIADQKAVWYVRNLGDGSPTATLFPPGLHMVTSRDPDDPASPRIARHLPRFQAAPPPEPPDWSTWPSLLADRSGPAEAALNVPDHGGFGTVCASLLGLPAAGAPNWLFAAGPPDLAPFQPVE